MSEIDRAEHTPVTSYATRGLRLWAAPLNPHGRHCRCLSCADARAYMKYPAMQPPMVTALQREEGAS